jgi:Flp pilus assembly protein TadG
MVGVVMKTIRDRTRTRKARAAAVVEFAVVTPLLITLLFGIMEYGHVFMVRQSMVTAAREGCRIAVLQTTTDPYTEVTDRIAELMNGAGVSNYTVDMTHATAQNPTESVRIITAMSDVSLLGGFLLPQEKNMVVTCSMRKEGVNATPGG